MMARNRLRPGGAVSTAKTVWGVIFQRLVRQQIRYYDEARGCGSEHDFAALRSDIADKIVADLEAEGLIPSRPALCADCKQTAAALDLTPNERLAMLAPKADEGPLLGQDVLDFGEVS